jgi:hypothetical protein
MTGPDLDRDLETIGRRLSPRLGQAHDAVVGRATVSMDGRARWPRPGRLGGAVATLAVTAGFGTLLAVGVATRPGPDTPADRGPSVAMATTTPGVPASSDAAGAGEATPVPGGGPVATAPSATTVAPAPPGLAATTAPSGGPVPTLPAPPGQGPHATAAPSGQRPHHHRAPRRRGRGRPLQPPGHVALDGPVEHRRDRGHTQLGEREERRQRQGRVHRPREERQRRPPGQPGPRLRHRDPPLPAPAADRLQGHDRRGLTSRPGPAVDHLTERRRALERYRRLG